MNCLLITIKSTSHSHLEKRNFSVALAHEIYFNTQTEMSCHVPGVIIYSSVISNVLLDYAVQEGMYNLYFGGICNATTACKCSPRLDNVGGHLPVLQL